MRRTKQNYSSDLLQFKDLIINLNTREAQIKDNKILLQGKQFDMLEYLMGFRNTIITKEQIFDKIWGFNSETTNVVEVYASDK